MPRKRKDPAAATAPMPTPRIIDPNAVFFSEEVRATLRLTGSTMRREIRLGRLRVARRAGKYLVLGRWVLEWIESGEVKRNAAEQAVTETSQA